MSYSKMKSERHFYRVFLLFILVLRTYFLLLIQPLSY